MEPRPPALRGAAAWLPTNARYRNRKWLLSDSPDDLVRPQPAGRGYVSISAGGVPGDRVEWPVFGEEIDNLTASTRPGAVLHEHAP